MTPRPAPTAAQKVITQFKLDVFRRLREQRKAAGRPAYPRPKKRHRPDPAWQPLPEEASTINRLIALADEAEAAGKQARLKSLLMDLQEVLWATAISIAERISEQENAAPESIPGDLRTRLARPWNDPRNLPTFEEEE